MSVQEREMLIVAEVNNMRAVTGADGQIYLDQADLVAWLRRCALESSGSVVSSTAAGLANAIELFREVAK